MHAVQGRGRLPSKTHKCEKCTTSVADNSDAVVLKVRELDPSGLQ